MTSLDNIFSELMDANPDCIEFTKEVFKPLFEEAQASVMLQKYAHESWPRFLLEFLANSEGSFKIILASGIALGMLLRDRQAQDKELEKIADANN